MKMYPLQKGVAFSSYIAMLDPYGRNVPPGIISLWMSREKSPGYSELANPGANNGVMEKYFGPLVVFMESTLRKTNIAPENRPSQKGISSSNHPYSGAMLGRVLGGSSQLASSYLANLW